MRRPSKNFNRVATEHGGGRGSPRLARSAWVAGRRPCPGRSVGLSVCLSGGRCERGDGGRHPASNSFVAFATRAPVLVLQKFVKLFVEHGGGRWSPLLARSAGVIGRRPCPGRSMGPAVGVTTVTIIVGTGGETRSPFVPITVSSCAL